MQEAIFKSSVLVDALPYMQRFHGKYVVVKFGGSVLTESEHLHNVLQDLVFMSQAGMRPVLVHGGGPLISGAMKEAGKEPVFINGQRVTDEETLEIAKSVLIDDVGKRIVSTIESLGGQAQSVNAKGVIMAEKHMPNGNDLGFVGHITSIKKSLFDELCEKNIIPIVSPLGLDEAGQMYNINGDIAAWKIAAELKAEKLVFLSNIKGILRDVSDEKSLISTLRRQRIQSYIDRGIIAGGMIPKVRAAEEALDHGVQKTHIIDGRMRHALLVEIFSKEGVGTQIIKGSEPEEYHAKQTRELYDKYVIGNYTRLPVVMNRAKGSRVWDSSGRSYIDLFPGWAVSGTGYGHDKVIEAIENQAHELIHVSNNFHMDQQATLARLIAEHSFGGKSFFCNSGAEANEAAFKLARLVHGGKRPTIISTLSSFHGRTFASVTATGQEGYREGFGPLVPGFKYIPFNDVKALEAAMGDDVCAVILEPIQGEGGINVASDEFMKAIRASCDSTGALMIVDEVQTCMGRTGRLFAYQNYDVEPDVMTLAKSLGGGVAIGAMTAKAEYASSLKPGTHGSTFGGNALACAAGIAVFDVIREEQLLANVETLSKFVWETLEGFKQRFDFIKEIRGTALMVGVELTIPGADIVSSCFEQGLIINCTQGNVLRFLPAINITKDELEEGFVIFEKVLEAQL